MLPTSAANNIIRATTSSSRSRRTIALSALSWLDLHIPPDELRPQNTLMMGQCFQWRPLSLPVTQTFTQTDTQTDTLMWTGVVDDIPLIVRQLPHTTQIASLFPQNDEQEGQLMKRMMDYFQVEHSLPVLYDEWGNRCERMKVIASCLQGVRVLRQDPWECLVSFICSSNNNIGRIALMLDRLRTNYGSYLCTLNVNVDENTITISNDEENGGNMDHNPEKKKRKNSSEDDSALTQNKTTSFTFYSFPSVKRLSSVSEDELRGLGMGYRAKFIKGTANLIHNKEGGADKWFSALRQLGKVNFTESGDNVEMNNSRLQVQSALLELPGVGRKVADCVALFSLDQTNAIPVDVHVWSIAVRDYNPELAENKSLTPTVYEEVGAVFRKLFVRHAGWAHSVLFAAELPGFRDTLPQQLQSDMEQFAAKRKVAKKEKKDQQQLAKLSKTTKKMAVESTISTSKKINSNKKQRQSTINV